MVRCYVRPWWVRGAAIRSRSGELHLSPILNPTAPLPVQHQDSNGLVRLRHQHRAIGFARPSRAYFHHWNTSLSSQEYHEKLGAFYRHRGATGMPMPMPSGAFVGDAQEDRPLHSPGDAAAVAAAGAAALAASASAASIGGSASGVNKETMPLTGSPLTRGLGIDSSRHGGGGGSRHGSSSSNLPALSAGGDAAEDPAAATAAAATPAAGSRMSAQIGASSSGARGGTGGGMTSAAGSRAVEETWWVMHEVSPMGTPSTSVQSGLSTEGGGGGGGGGGGAGARAAAPTKLGAGRSGGGGGGGGGGTHQGDEPSTGLGGSRALRKKLDDGADTDGVATSRASDGGGGAVGAAAVAGFGDGGAEEGGGGVSSTPAGANHGKGLGKRRLCESNDMSRLEAQMRSSAKVGYVRSIG